MGTKFYIQNEKGDRWGLNSASNGIFISPSGFGIKYEGSYIKVGDTWQTERVVLEQPTPSGKMLFPYRSYIVFQEFLKFINISKALTLVYKPSSIDTEYMAEIDVVEINKSGFSRGKVLEVPVKFVCKTLFHTAETFEYRIEKVEREVRFDFRWETHFNDKNYVYFDLINDGHTDSPFLLTFNGYCTNPEIIIMQDGKLIKKMIMNIMLQGTETLSFSTFDGELHLEVDGVDRKDCLDFTQENFFKIPQGRCQIYFRSATGRMNNIKVSFEKYYKGV